MSAQDDGLVFSSLIGGSIDLRDHIATMAMHALITALDGPPADDPSPMRDANLSVIAADDIAKHAYLYAAAMLAARSKR